VIKNYHIIYFYLPEIMLIDLYHLQQDASCRLWRNVLETKCRLSFRWFKDVTSSASWQAVQLDIKKMSEKNLILLRSTSEVYKDLYRQTIQTNASLKSVLLLATFLDVVYDNHGRSASREGQMNKCRFEKPYTKSQLRLYKATHWSDSVIILWVSRCLPLW
jgi:hypothetical protein